MLSAFLLLEFFAWKQRVQRETFTDWASTRTNPTKDGKRIYYRCNRSGCPRVNNQELNESSHTKECDEEKTTESQTVEPKQNHANHHGTEDVEADEWWVVGHEELFVALLLLLECRLCWPFLLSSRQIDSNCLAG